MKNLQEQLFEAAQNLGFGVTEGSGNWFFFQRPNKTRLGGIKVKENSIQLVIDAKKDTTLGRLLNDLIISDKKEESNHDTYPFSVYDEGSLIKAIDLMTLASSIPQDMRIKLK